MSDELRAGIRRIVGEACGSASMCWNPRPGDQVFDSSLAVKYVDDAMAQINDLLEAEKRANLGLATTREMLAEITARIEVDGASGGGGLDYTTVSAS